MNNYIEGFQMSVPADRNRFVRTKVMKVEGNSNKCYISNYVSVTMTHMVT